MPGLSCGSGRGFLVLSEGEGRTFAERAAEFSGLCDRLAAGGSAAVVALAADLRLRADVLGFVLSGLGPARRGPLVTRLAAVANGYRDADDPREAVATLGGRPRSRVAAWPLTG